MRDGAARCLLCEMCPRKTCGVNCAISSLCQPGHATSQQNPVLTSSVVQRATRDEFLGFCLAGWMDGYLHYARPDVLAGMASAMHRWHGNCFRLERCGGRVRPCDRTVFPLGPRNDRLIYCNFPNDDKGETGARKADVVCTGLCRSFASRARLAMCVNNCAISNCSISALCPSLGPQHRSRVLS